MELLEQHFDTAFAASDGIKKLRELILTLAMQGRLVPQDPSDPPANQLLKDIDAEKSRLWRDGKIKVPKPLPEIKPAEMPYALPQGWEWVRLGEIGVWKSGSTPSRNNSKYYGGDIPWVKSGEVKQGRIAMTEELITELALNECSLSLNPVGSVLVAMYGANIGEVGILDIEAATNQAVCACRTYTAFDERYLLNLIASLKPYFISQGAGAAQPNISREKIVATPFPLPPLPEQHRIVAKIDQLMARCDKLERLRAERERKRGSVHAAALKQLLDAQAADNIADAWQFISQYFGDLYAVKENVVELRNAVLQLAVTGKLVLQNPNDPPAGQLLKEIEAEKKRLVKEGKIKTQKLPERIAEDEIGFELPDGWAWARFGDFALDVSTGPFGSLIHQSDYVSGGVPLVNPSHMIDGRIVPDHSVSLSIEMAKSMDSYRLNNGDMVMARRGEVGRVALVTEVEDGWLCGTGSFVLRFTPQVSRAFVCTLFRCASVRSYLAGAAVGTTMVNLNHGILLKMPIAVPPLAEQHRIVAKVDQLMALCDTLEQQIDAATSKQTELLNALMAPV